MQVVPDRPTVPVVFDRPLVLRRLARAVANAGGDFLLDRAVEDLVERLKPVQRTFHRIVDIGTPRPSAALCLASTWPDAVVFRAASIAESSTATHATVVMDEERSALGTDQFDLAVSLMSLHTANDLPGALTQIRRALKPDGLFLAALLGGQSLQELRNVLAEAEAELTGGASPRVAPFSDLRDLGHLLQRAGFALPVTDLDRVTVRYDSMFGLMHDLRTLGATNALADRSRRPATRALFVRAAELYALRHSDADGRVRATFDIVWLSGWAPHESQQKPLKPGSAKMRLADALGVKEIKPD